MVARHLSEYSTARQRPLEHSRKPKACLPRCGRNGLRLPAFAYPAAFSFSNRCRLAFQWLRATGMYRLTCAVMHRLLVIWRRSLKHKGSPLPLTGARSGRLERGATRQALGRLNPATRMSQMTSLQPPALAMADRAARADFSKASRAVPLRPGGRARQRPWSAPRLKPLLKGPPAARASPTSRLPNALPHLGHSTAV